MAPYARILVPLACGDGDEELVRYAAMVSRIQSGARIEIVHVTSRPWSEIDDVWKRMQAAVDYLSAEAELCTEVSSHILEGDLTDRLLEFASECGADLVLAGHGRGRSGRRSLARRLAMQAPCSVWMVPKGSSEFIHRIIAPVDFSERSADSLREAIGLAFLAGVKQITALHVHFDQTTFTFDERDKLLRGREEEVFNRFLDPIDRRGVEIVPEFVEAPSVSWAISLISGQDKDGLVVMGTRGRSRAAAVLLGSEIEQVMIESAVPVLAVKHFGASRSLLEVLLDRRTRGRERPLFG